MMGLASVFRVLGFGILSLAGMMMGPYLYGLATGLAGTGDYLFAAVVALIGGGGLVIASGNQRPRTDFRAGIFLVLLWWFIAPIFAAMPFVLKAMAPLDAYFLAVSGLTTTGAWLARDAIIADPLAHLWLAICQWVGGIVSIAVAASIIVRPAFFGVETLQLPFSRGEKDSYLRSLRNALYTFIPVYSGLSILCFLLLYINGLDGFNSMILSLSVVASGGMSGTQASIADYPALTSGILFVFIILSGTNFVLIAFAMRGQWKKVKDRETETFLAMIAAVGILFWLLTGGGDINRVINQFFNAASMITTSGLHLGIAPPLTVACVAALIGGAAISSVGGMKVLRWLVIIRRSREEIRRLISPNVVQGNISIADEFGVWMHFLVFTLVLGAVVLLLSLAGHQFDVSAAAAVGALSNTGPLLALSNAPAADYAIFNDAARCVLILVMILGRIEAVAALIIINRAFWRS